MHKSFFFFSMFCVVSAVALAASSQDNAILADAYRTQLHYREGHPEVARPLVKKLEAAVAKSPDNARLWEALGFAYMSLQGSMYTGTPACPPSSPPANTRARPLGARWRSMARARWSGRATACRS